MIPRTSPSAVEPGGNLGPMDRLCDEFELWWRGGRRPSLRAFLSRAPADVRSDAFSELLALDVGYRQQLGERPSATEYQREFEEFTAIVDRQFGRMALDDTTGPPAKSPAAWPRIDGLEIVRLLGRGGMGVVYLAEQRALKRQVALKMLRSGADAGEEERTRFRMEVESAASLQHPNIVQVHEVGEFEGQPYCVMEFIAGESLRDLTRRGPQPADVAAELMMTLAHALHHAHERGIIHRDLKPANILLEMVGAPAAVQTIVAGGDTEGPAGSAPTNASDPGKSKRSESRREGLVYCDQGVVFPQWLRPKVSDFGLARRLEAVDTAHTQTGAILGTPAYMAPEQAMGRSKEVGAATDVYALGAVLYELLTGRPPHQAAGVMETLDLIRHQEPVAPRVLQPRVPRDLNTICMKCLQRDPPRRYASASALAQDLQRFLAGQPVQARPVGHLERSAKWVRRNPAVAGLMAIVLLVAGLGFSGTYWRLLAEQSARRDADSARDAEAQQRIVAQQARTEAENEAATARAISEFLREDLLKQAGPHSGPDRDVTLRTVLDRAAQKVAGRFTNQPLVEAALRRTLGATYFELGDYDQSEPHLKRAYELWDGAAGSEHPDTLTAMASLALLYKSQGRYAEAEPLYQRSLAGLRRIAGEEHVDTLAAMNSMAVFLKILGRYKEAEQLHLRVWELRRRTRGEEHPDTLTTMNNLAELYNALGRGDEGAALSRRVLEARRRVLGDEHPDTLTSMNNLAGVLELQLRYDEAASLYEQTIETMRRVLEDDHPKTLNTMNNLAALHQSQGHYKKAELLYGQVWEGRRRVLGAEHPDTLVSINNMADLYIEQRRHAEAEPLLRQIVAVQSQLQGSEHPRTLIYMNNLASALRTLGRYSEAEPIYLRIVEAQRRALGDDHADTLAFMNNLALLYKQQGRHKDAEPLYQEILATRRRLLGDNHRDTLLSMNNLGALFKAAGRDADAQPLYEQALEGRRALLGDDHPETLTSMSNLTLLYKAQQRYAQAEPLYVELIQRSKAKLGEAHVDTLDRMTGLATLYESTQEWQKAAEGYARQLEIRRRHPVETSEASLASCLTALSCCLNKLEEYKQAEPLAKEAVDWRRRQKSNGWQLGQACSALGASLAGQHRFDEAEPLLLEAWKTVQAPQEAVPRASRHRFLAECSRSIIDLYAAWDKPDLAKKWEEETAELATKE